MASLLDTDTIAEFTGIFAGHFDTFSAVLPNIVVFKEPLQNIVDSNQNVLPGYENSSNINNITYAPVSGVYPAIRLYPDKNGMVALSEIKSLIFKDADVVIKVKSDAKDYILNGKTEKVLVDNNNFNVLSEPVVQNYLGLEYYYFGLSRTK